MLSELCDIFEIHNAAYERHDEMYRKYTINQPDIICMCVDIDRWLPMQIWHEFIWYTAWVLMKLLDADHIVTKDKINFISGRLHGNQESVAFNKWY